MANNTSNQEKAYHIHAGSRAYSAVYVEPKINQSIDIKNYKTELVIVRASIDANNQSFTFFAQDDKLDLKSLVCEVAQVHSWANSTMPFKHICLLTDTNKITIQLKKDGCFENPQKIFTFAFCNCSCLAQK